MPAETEQEPIEDDIAAAFTRAKDTPEPEPEPAKAPAAKEPPKEPAKAKVEAKEVKQPDDALFDTPKPAAKPDKAPEQDEEPPKGMTKEAARAFAEQRREAKALKSETENLRTELNSALEKIKQFEAKPESSEQLVRELEELRTEREEIENELKLSRLESSRTYKEKIKLPRASLESKAKKIAQQYETDERDLLRILNFNDPTSRKQLKEYASEFDEVDKNDLYDLKRKFDGLAETEEQLREEVKQKGEKLFQEEQQKEGQTKEEHLKTLQSSADKVWSKASETWAFLKDLDTNVEDPAARTQREEWNKALHAARKESTQPIDDPNTAGEVRAKAAQLPFVLKFLENRNRKLETVTAERDALLARIEEDSQLEPGAGGNGHEAPEVDENEEASLGQIVTARNRSA